MKIILATHNSGKLKEFSELVAPLGIILSKQDFPNSEETGLTFIENAILKARHAAKHSQLPALADDSGLVVPALDNAPGIYSARYAGHNASANENIEKLLKQMSDISVRNAYFYSAIAYLNSATDAIPLIGIGIWHGEILKEPQGKNGFGYDPIFYLPSHGCSAAELAPEVKNQISHRGLAFKQFIQLWQNR